MVSGHSSEMNCYEGSPENRKIIYKVEFSTVFNFNSFMLYSTAATHTNPLDINVQHEF